MFIHESAVDCAVLGVRTRIYGATYGTYFDYMEARTQSGGNLFNVRAYYTTTSITGYDMQLIFLLHFSDSKILVNE